MNVVLVKQPYDIAFSGNPLVFVFNFSPYGSNEAGVDIRLQLKVLVEAVPGSNSFIEVRSQVFYPDDSGAVTVDVHSIVHPYLDYYVPRLSLSKPVQATTQRKRYKLAYLATKNGAIIANTSTAVYTVIKGGLSVQASAGHTFFTTNIAADKSALNYPRTRTISLTDPLFFYWCYPLTDNALQDVRVVVQLEDGTSQLYTLPTSIACTQWGVCVAPIKVLELYTGSLLIKSFSVSIVVDVVTIVAPQTYVVDHRNFYNTTTFLYRSSTGGLETLRVRGQIDAEADYATQSAIRVTPDAFINSILQAQAVHGETVETRIFKGDTGFLSKGDAEAVRDFLLSEERWEVVGGKMIPIEVAAKNTKLWSNKDNLISIALEWSHAVTNTWYTPAGAITAPATCLTPETFVVTQVSKKLLQIMWSLPEPYDAIEVQITIGSVITNYQYSGAHGSMRQPFANPGGLTIITVAGRTICDADAGSRSAWATRNVAIVTNSPVVVLDDHFTIAGGFNSAVTLPTSVLANDYDPDGDTIVALPVSGTPVTGGSYYTTNAGGVYSITADGIVSYVPPSSSFQGQDYFDYGAHETAGGTTVTGRCYINVGTTVTAVFARLVIRNEVGSVWDNGGTASHEVWIDFFTDPQCSQPLNVTSLNLTFNYRVNDYNIDFQGSQSSVNTDLTIAGTGTKVKLFEGTYSTYATQDGANYTQAAIETHTLLTGAGYTVV